MAYLPKQVVEVEEVEVKDAEAVPTEVERDENTDKVVSVKVDEKLSADDPNAVQIPPEADASEVDGQGVHDEPTPLEAAAAAAEEAPEDDSSDADSDA